MRRDKPMLHSRKPTKRRFHLYSSCGVVDQLKIWKFFHKNIYIKRPEMMIDIVNMIALCALNKISLYMLTMGHRNKNILTSNPANFIERVEKILFVKVF